jgi:hypothetical protein
MRVRNRSQGNAWLLGATLIAACNIASADAPQLTYSPVPDQGGAEVTSFQSTEGDSLMALITVTPVGGTPTDPPPPATNTSLLLCSLADEGGDQNINLSPQNLLFIGGTDVDPKTLTVSCTPLASASFATLTCAERIGGTDTGDRVWDVVCPAGGDPVPELVAIPAPGLGLAMSSAQPIDDTDNITIQNVGNATLNITSIGGLAPPFSVAPGNAAIAAAGQQVFVVTCDGATEGAYFDQLTVNSDDADEGAIAYDVSCTVSGAEFDGVPSPGTPIVLQTVQAQNVSTPISVFNSGNATLNVTGLSLVDASGKLTASIDDPTIDAGASAIITVACNAGALGSSGARTLTFNTNDVDGGETSVSYPNISCDVTAPSLAEFDPGIAPPGPINLAGTTAVAATPVVVTITNSGTAALNITNLSAFNAAPSPALSRTLSSASIAAGGNATLTFNCSSGVATTDTETLTFNTNDGDDGEGLVTFNVACSITSGTAPEYASIPPANQGAPSTITINTTQGLIGSKILAMQNVGTAQLTGISVQTQPVNPPFLPVTIPSATLNAGASQMVTVSCSSNTAGTTPGTLVIATGNDLDELVNTYPVSCVVAEAAEFDATPAAPGPISFVTNEDELAATSITLKNLGTTNLTITAIDVLGSPAPNPFTFSTGPLPITIAPGATSNATVRCLSTTPANYSGTATLTTNDLDDGEINVVFNLSCRVNLVAPEFGSTPGAGATFQFYTNPDTTPPLPPPTPFEPFTTVVRITNSGNATLNYSLSGLSGFFSSSPATPGNYTVTAGDSTNISVTCSGANSSTVTQTLSIAHNDSNETPATYTFKCIPDIRRAALPMLRALIGSPIVTDPGNELFANGFE